MALPRRCKHCRCYVADWLKRCPRCDKSVPAPVVVKQTKEDKAEARSVKDARVPVIHQARMQWAPSALAIKSHQASLHAAQRRMSDAETPRQRNALRSEIRHLKDLIERKTDPKFRWTREIFHGRLASILIFISPSGRRYVLADADTPADLIIKNRKRAGIPFSRLQRFEKSVHAKSVKTEKRDQSAHKKRVSAKKAKRLAHQKLLRTTTLPQETT